MAQSFEAWFQSLGPIARYSLIVPCIIALAVSLQMASPMLFLLFWEKVTDEFEVWRLLTSFLFFGKFSFPFVMNLAMFVVYQRRHEEDFGARMSDHIFMLLFLWVLYLPLSYLFSMLAPSFALTMSLIWIWCKRHEEAMLSIYGFSFKAQYFPWVMILLHLVMGGSIADDIIGIIAGHVYFFLKDMLPLTNNVKLLETPRWLEQQFPNSTQTVFGTHIPTQRQTAPTAPRQTWGTGRALGTGN